MISGIHSPLADADALLRTVQDHVNGLVRTGPVFTRKELYETGVLLRLTGLKLMRLSDDVREPEPGRRTE